MSDYRCRVGESVWFGLWLVKTTSLERVPKLDLQEDRVEVGRRSNGVKKNQKKTITFLLIINPNLNLCYTNLKNGSMYLSSVKLNIFQNLSNPPPIQI